MNAFCTITHFQKFRKKHYRPCSNELAHGQVVRLCTDPEGVIDALKIKIKNAKTSERHRALKRGSDMMFSFVFLRIATQLYIYNGF